MKYIKKIAALIVTAYAAVSCLSLNVYAEEEVSSSEKEYIKSGDYEYSVETFDDGSEGAILQKYSGNDTEIELPDTIDDYKVRGLGSLTFYFNKEITQVTLSENIEKIGYSPFYGCSSLMEFKVDNDSKFFKSDSEGVLITKDGLSLVSYPTGKDPEKYTVSDGILSIGASAFAMCSNLKEINLPESLVFIDIYAFAECTALESVELPDDLTELQDFTFSSCTSLSDVKLPENLTVIHDAVFFDCKALTHIDFPKSLYEIGQAAFCSTGLTSITIPETIASIGYSAFGFHTDENEQIVADEDFIVQGYSNSYAKTYCLENEVTFVPLDEPTEDSETETETTPVKSEEKKTIPIGTIVGICMVFAVALTAFVIVIVKVSKRSASKKIDDENENDETEEEE